MPSKSATTPIDITTITPVLSPSSTEPDATLSSSPDTPAFSLDPPPSLIPSTTSSTDMTGEAVVESSPNATPNGVLSRTTPAADEFEESLPVGLLPPQDDQTPKKSPHSPTINITPTKEYSNSRSTTPRPPTITTTPSSSASLEENQRQEQKEGDLSFEPCPPLTRASSVSLSGANTPTPLSSISGDVTPTPGQRDRGLRVSTGGPPTAVLMHDGSTRLEDMQLQQQRVFYDEEDGSAVVHLRPLNGSGSGQTAPQAPEIIDIPSASSSGEPNEERDLHIGSGEGAKVDVSVVGIGPSDSSTSNTAQYATYPHSYDILPPAPQSAPSLASTWSDPTISPISGSTPASRRTSASVDEFLIPPSSASSATFPSSASSLSTSFVSSASSSSLAFSVTSSDWGSNEGGWDPAFVYGFDHTQGERKSDSTYSLKTGYPSPFFVDAGGYTHSNAGMRSSISLGRDGGYGDPLQDTEAARLGLSPDPSAASASSIKRVRFLSSNTGSRGRRWGVGAVVRALVRPIRAGVMWTLSPLSGRSYASPFLSVSSPFRRPSRPLTSSTTTPKSSSSAQKPADFTPLFHLCLYFMLNLSLTLYNKKILGRFPFPYTLTAVHALCGWIGTGAMVWWAGRDSGFGRLRALSNAVSGIRGGTRSGGPEGQSGIGAMLSGKERLVLLAFSVLYTVNIVVSNASLRLVTVPFHQVVRASAPFFTILFSAILLGKRASGRKLLSLVPVVIGVGFATYGDYYFTPLGFFLTLLGTLLAALKTILTNVILVKPGASSSTSLLPTLNHAPVDAKHMASASTTGTDEGFVGIELSQPHIRHGADDGKESQNRDSDSIAMIIGDDKPHDEKERGWKTGDTSGISFIGSMFRLAESVFRKRTRRSESSPTLPTSSSIPQPPNLLQTPTGPGTFTLGLIGLSSVRLPKLSLTPLHLLYLLSPLAFMQTMILAQFTGELVYVRGWLFGSANSALADTIGTATSAVSKNMVGVVGTGGARWSLALNGVMAFMLNVVSFNANRRVGPLGMSVAANVKQVLTILCAVSMFDLTITPANGLGIGLTLLGGATYAYVEVSERRAAAAAASGYSPIARPSSSSTHAAGDHQSSHTSSVSLPMPGGSKSTAMSNVTG